MAEEVEFMDKVKMCPGLEKQAAFEHCSGAIMIFSQEYLQSREAKPLKTLLMVVF